MNMAKIARAIGSLIFLASMVCLAGFWWGRTTGHDDIGIRVFDQGLRYTFYVAIGCIAYMLVLGGWTIFKIWILGEEEEPLPDDSEAP